MPQNKIRLFFSNIHFKLSDLFLAIGFIPMVVFLINGQLFMQYIDPAEVNLPLGLIIALFIILLASWGVYIYLEYKNGNKVNRNINIIFIFLLLIGLIGIFIQPKNFSIDFISTYGEQSHAEMIISDTHYVFFASDIVSILLFIYIGLFIFPKRFKTTIFMQIIGYLVFLGCFAVIVYSYIMEADNYGMLIEAVKNSNIYAIRIYSLKSFIINSNAYGMLMMIGIIFCCILHAISKRWWYWLISGFLYANMIFSFCRTSLLFSLIIVFIYVYYNLIKNMQNKARILLIVITLSAFLLVALIIVICYSSKGNFLPFLYKLISVIDTKDTLSSREFIWNNVYSLISQSLPTSLFFGKGFGLINEMLLQMNISSGFEYQYSFPTHNSYLNLLAEGGLFYLFAYIALMFYMGVVCIKCFKKQAPLTLAVALGTLVFIFYSLIETIHYLVYPFMFLLIVVYNIQTTSEKQSNI